MEIEYTNRGFEIIKFKDRYNEQCSLQQSSLADHLPPGSSAIWFGIGDNRMHIHEDLLDDLLPHLIAWNETGSFKINNKNEPMIGDFADEVDQLRARIAELAEKVVDILEAALSKEVNP